MRRSPAIVKSPLGGVDDAAWTQFVIGMGTPDFVRAVDDGGRVGLFLFSPARLASLGLATNLRDEAINGARKWVADVPPEFLTDPNRQYRAFATSTVAYAKDLASGRLRTPAPAMVDEKPVTLSGLLAVAHRAGFKGLSRWLKSARDRADHPFTTSSFLLNTGVF